MYKERISTIAERLSEALSLKGMRPIELCRILKISKGTLSHYMNGDHEPRQERIEAISTALNISEAWLMGYDVPMDRQEYYSLSEGKSPSVEPELTEGEKKLIELFRLLPVGEQDMYLEVLQARLNARAKGQAQS